MTCCQCGNEVTVELGEAGQDMLSLVTAGVGVDLSYRFGYEVAVSIDGGKFDIVYYVTISVQEGSCVGILGGNGSGKTTLLSILMGVQKADNGSFLWGGADLFYDEKTRGQKREANV